MLIDATIDHRSFLLLAIGLNALSHERAIAQKSDGAVPADWVAEIEKVFIRSEDCKQCHDRHYEEWKGMREQTPDLKTFGRVDAALLHGTSLESPVFRTVLGVWMQTNPTPDERQRCLSCHVAVHDGISPTCRKDCRAGLVRQTAGRRDRLRHLSSDQRRGNHALPPPTFKLKPGKMLYGPFADPEENLVHSGRNPICSVARTTAHPAISTK